MTIYLIILAAVAVISYLIGHYVGVTKCRKEKSDILDI